MNVLFIVPRIDKASSRLRVLQYIDPLKQYNIDSTVIVSPKTILQKIKLIRAVSKYDIVFIQKKLFQPWELYIIRFISKTLIYDVDDAVMFDDICDDRNYTPKGNWKFRSTIFLYDHIIVGNHYLKDYIFFYNNNITIIPTPIDIHKYKPKFYQENQLQITIGWIGSKSTIKYLEQIKDVLDAIGKKYNHVIMKIVSDQFIDCDYIQVIKKKWDEKDELLDLQSFDIGLMPLKDDYWTRGKCGFKLIQYSAMGLPSICSPVGINKEIIDDGESGFHASSHEEWIDKLSILIENADVRKKFGLKSRKKIENLYSIEKNVNKLAYLLRSFKA